MSSSIYDISSWAASTNYNKFDIVSESNFYYYANYAHLSTSTFLTDLTAGAWAGKITDNGEVKKHFIWKPSYRGTTDNEPKVKKIQFGDQYKQLLPDGISNILPVYNLTFDGIDLSETSAILHFLENCGGSESFLYVANAPRGKLARYTCSKWSDSFNFFNNYSINAVFERAVT